MARQHHSVGRRSAAPEMVFYHPAGDERQRAQTEQQMQLARVPTGDPIVRWNM